MGFPQRRSTPPVAPAGPASPDVTVALTGVSAAGALGALAIALTLATTGVSATANQGSITPQTSIGLAGQVATGSVGTLAPSATVGVTGVAGTGAPGTLVPGFTLALLGNASAGSIGTVAPATSPALTGVVVTGSRGTLTPATSPALTGISAAGSRGTLGPAASVALLGASATGSIGTLSAQGSSSTSAALAGVSATGSVGALAPSVTVAMTGVGAAAQGGSLGSARSVSAIGVVGTGQPGALLPELSATLASTAATAAIGSVQPSSILALGGVEGSGRIGALVPEGGTPIVHSEIIALSASSSALVQLAGASTRNVTLSGSSTRNVSLTAAASMSALAEYRAAILRVKDQFGNSMVVAHWDLGDAGPVFIDTINGSNGVSHGNVTPLQPGPVEGARAARFGPNVGGIGTRIEVPQSSLNLAGNSVYSHEAWFKLDVSPADLPDFTTMALWFWLNAQGINLTSVLAEESATGQAFWYMDASVLTTPSANISTIFTTDFNTFPFPELFHFEVGQYHHVVQTFGNRHMSLYLDGHLFQTVTLGAAGSYALNGYNEQLAFGNSAVVRPVTEASYTAPWLGCIGQVSVYIVEMTAADVLDLYTRGRATSQLKDMLSGSSSAIIPLTGST